MADHATGGPRRPSVVALGGGHGLSRTLQALRHLDVDITAVVATADDGGSSGRLRRSLDVLPPGDLRQALAALTPDRELAALLQYRFPAGDVAGHTVGNLLMVAATDLRGGDLVAALDALGGLLGATGRVLPASLEPLELIAEGPEGEVRGQLAVATSSGHRRVRIAPGEAAACPAAVAAVAAADLVLLGPGSLFTSILATLAVPEVAAAVADTPARVCFVANLREQPGETEGLDLAGHLDVLARHLPGARVDVVLAHDGRPPSGPGAPLVLAGPHPVADRIVRADLLDGDDGHDPDRLARVLADLLPPS